MVAKGLKGVAEDMVETLKESVDLYTDVRCPNPRCLCVLTFGLQFNTFEDGAKILREWRQRSADLKKKKRDPKPVPRRKRKTTDKVEELRHLLGGNDDDGSDEDDDNEDDEDDEDDEGDETDEDEDKADGDSEEEEDDEDVAGEAEGACNHEITLLENEPPPGPKEKTKVLFTPKVFKNYLFVLLFFISLLLFPAVSCSQSSLFYHYIHSATRNKDMVEEWPGARNTGPTPKWSPRPTRFASK